MSVEVIVRLWYMHFITYNIGREFLEHLIYSAAHGKEVCILMYSVCDCRVVCLQHFVSCLSHWNKDTDMNPTLHPRLPLTKKSYLVSVNVYSSFMWCYTSCCCSSSYNFNLSKTRSTILHGVQWNIVFQFHDANCSRLPLPNCDDTIC